jgi:hypothetical protein
MDSAGIFQSATTSYEPLELRWLAFKCLTFLQFFQKKTKTGTINTTSQHLYDPIIFILYYIYVHFHVVFVHYLSTNNQYLEPALL